MNLEEAERKFHTDHTFAQVVTLLEQFLYAMVITPSEVRDAATFAACRVELRRLQQGCYQVTREEFERLWPVDPDKEYHARLVAIPYEKWKNYVFNDWTHEIDESS